MNFEQLKNQLPEYAKDVKLNLAILTSNDIADLSLKQIAGMALASAYTTQQPQVVLAIKSHADEYLNQQEMDGTKAAAAIMAMNNIYYRFTHLVQDQSFTQMPAKLRMNIMANPGIPKIDFELYSLAVSAINGCGKCLDAHVQTLQKEGLSNEAIQTCIRIAAVINSAAQVLKIEQPS